MSQVRIYNTNHPGMPALQAGYCASFACQLRGLTFRRSLPTGEGLLLAGKRDSRVDSAIHMFFVWFDLAVVWINDSGEVVDVQLARRWRPMYISQKPARYVLEIGAQRLEDFHIGDHVRFEALTS